jgi:hypothetical protein
MDQPGGHQKSRINDEQRGDQYSDDGKQLTKNTGRHGVFKKDNSRGIRP